MRKADILAISRFKANIASLHQLMQFDDLLLEFIIGPLRRLSQRHEKAKIPLHNRPNAILKVLENIKDNQSLRPYYEAMYNQCLVLLVSYFASATRQLFVDAISAAIDEGTIPKVLDVKLHITPRDLREAVQPTAELLAESIADGKDVSFQDMQSIDRTFREYFGSTPDKDARVHDIIVGQACRHAIVHTAAHVDKRLVTQLRSAVPRSIKPQIKEGDILHFSREEIQEVARAMHGYLRAMANIIEATGTRLPRQSASQ
jgi:hypothetical protein